MLIFSSMQFLLVCVFRTKMLIVGYLKSVVLHLDPGMDEKQISVRSVTTFVYLQKDLFVGQDRANVNKEGLV